MEWSLVVDVNNCVNTEDTDVTEQRHKSKWHNIKRTARPKAKKETNTNMEKRLETTLKTKAWTIRSHIKPRVTSGAPEG